MYLDGGMGEEGGYLLLCFFSIIYILGLVCYKHTIHAVKHQLVLTCIIVYCDRSKTLVRSMASPCQFILFICIFKRVYSILVPWSPMAVNDVNAQPANLTGSMKLHKSKMHVVGHCFCCTIHRQHTVGGRNASRVPCIVLVIIMHKKENLVMRLGFPK